ncbi:uncharacterized protein [Neodiprion pinetum]|uniref:uncharacterized protein n=1 Tax=Neodiprion pinetum TaxID=441929 RepID=UPI001EDCB87B|nr:uncharacterized protein LOC124218257 [Neodiprion pinetum]
MENFQNLKPTDTSKYNLRCNRNISEKMTKKDFVYDIPAPFQLMRKVNEIRRQIVLPIQLRRKLGSDSKPPRYAVIPTNEGLELINESAEPHADQIPERKILRFQCNYCQERLATRLSLSTHVKYHCGTYCATCFWILKPEETMTQHFQTAHQVPIPVPNPSISVPRR